MQGRVFTGFTRVRVAEKKKRVQKRLKPSGIKPLRTDQKEKFGLLFCFNGGKGVQNANKFAYINIFLYLCGLISIMHILSLWQERKSIHMK